MRDREISQNYDEARDFLATMKLMGAKIGRIGLTIIVYFDELPDQIEDKSKWIRVNADWDKVVKTYENPLGDIDG